MRVYVASSWRNGYQTGVVEGLCEAGHEVYDFRNPAPGDDGFHWSEIDKAWKSWSVAQFTNGLKHPLAHRGFANDFTAMADSDACVLLLPCGRSAHLEAGWFVGAGKPLLILVSEIEPELMYKMADSVHADLKSVASRLNEIEESMPAIPGGCLPDGQPAPNI